MNHFSENFFYKKQNSNQTKQDTLTIFKQEILKDDLYLNNLISKDGKTSAIVAIIDAENFNPLYSQKHEEEHDPVEFRKRLVVEVREVISKYF